MSSIKHILSSVIVPMSNSFPATFGLPFYFTVTACCCVYLRSTLSRLKVSVKQNLSCGFRVSLAIFAGHIESKVDV